MAGRHAAGQDLTENELSEELLRKEPASTKANFLAGYLKGGKDKALQAFAADHVEVTLRITLCNLIGYIFTFANVRWITPIEQAPVLGILVPFCSMLFPTLMFSFGLLSMPMISIFVACFVSSTVLVSFAVVGGTPLFCVMFTIWSFWICQLRWDKVQGGKVSLILIGVVFQTLLIWPTFETVQHGFTVPSSPVGGPPLEAQKMLLEYLNDAIGTAVSLGAGEHDVMVESGVLEGRSALITVNEEGVFQNAMVEGGMWMVGARWTMSGVNNPLASYQNVLILLSWTIVILGVIPLLPPFRTMRSGVWRGMIPGALMDAAALLRAHVDKVEKAGLPSASSDGSLLEARGKVGQLLGKAIYHMNALYAGNVAKFTFFEPRVFSCKPAECTGGYLMHLCMHVSRIVSAAAGISLFTDHDFGYHNMDQYLLTAKNLETCAKALAIGNMSMLDGVELNNDAQEHDTFTMHQRTVQLVHLSRKWLGAMTGGGDRPSFCSPQSRQALFINLRPWLEIHISHFQHLGGYLLNLFKKETWMSLKGIQLGKDAANYATKDYAFEQLVWSIKYSVGMGFLLVISIYWPAYKDGFVVAEPGDPFRELIAIQNGGWVLVAYCFATTQTAEGSIKKGILRLAGTITGAFSAWLALLACEDSSFSTGYNTYGIVAWLTITTSIATYLSTDRGFLARVALSGDYAFGPLYFVITELIIIVGGTLFGPAARDVITVNRMVANIVGILMAVVLAIIPPGNYGGDPGHTKLINDHHWNSVKSVIEKASGCGGASDEEALALSKELQGLSMGMLQKSAKMIELASDFHADAARLQGMGFFQVDPMLKMQIGLVTMNSNVAAFVPSLIATILASDVTRPLLLDKNGIVQKKMKEIFNDMKRGGIQGPEPNKDVDFHLPITELVDSRDDIDLLVRCMGWLISEMRSRNKALQTIRWGSCKMMMGPLKR